MAATEGWGTLSRLIRAVINDTRKQYPDPPLNWGWWFNNYGPRPTQQLAVTNKDSHINVHTLTKLLTLHICAGCARCQRAGRLESERTSTQRDQCVCRQFINGFTVWEESCIYSSARSYLAF